MHCSLIIAAAYPVIQHQPDDRQEVRQHDILVCKTDPAFKSQIKRDLTDQGEHADAQQIVLFVMCMNIPFRNAEGKYGHSKPADHSRPHHTGQEYVTGMIKDHADHSDHFQHGSVKYLISFHTVHSGLSTSLPV